MESLICPFSSYASSVELINKFSGEKRLCMDLAMYNSCQLELYVIVWTLVLLSFPAGYEVNGGDKLLGLDLFRLKEISETASSIG